VVSGLDKHWVFERVGADKLAVNVDFAAGLVDMHAHNPDLFSRSRKACLTVGQFGWRSFRVLGQFSRIVGEMLGGVAGSSELHLAFR
jgi:hypothetical protein